MWSQAQLVIPRRMSDGQKLPREGNVILGHHFDLKEKCLKARWADLVFSFYSFLWVLELLSLLFLPGISNAFSFREVCLQHNRDILFHQFDAAHFLVALFLPKDMLPRVIQGLSHSWCETGQGPLCLNHCFPLDWLSYSVGLNNLSFLSWLPPFLMEYPSSQWPW